MELVIAYTDGSQTTDILTITKKLGRGKLSVYEVFSFAHKVNYALKVFPKTKFGTIQYSKEKLMFSLKHQHVIQRIPMACKNQNFYPLLTEYAPYGDFFDLLSSGCIHGEILIRTYFHQLIEGLEYIHSQGVAHLDLKLENLMLGRDFNLITSGGTMCYRAPEVIDGTCSNLAAADVYAAGIILFTLICKRFPFTEQEDLTHTDMDCYSTFVHDNKLFWLGKLRKKNKTSNRGFLSQDFIELLNGMWNPNPSLRFSLEQVKSSYWYQGLTFDEKTLQAQMALKLEGLNGK